MIQILVQHNAPSLIKAAATVDAEASPGVVLRGSLSKSGSCFACRDFFLIFLLSRLEYDRLARYQAFSMLRPSSSDISWGSKYRPNSQHFFWHRRLNFSLHYFKNNGTSSAKVLSLSLGPIPTSHKANYLLTVKQSLNFISIPAKINQVLR